MGPLLTQLSLVHLGALKHDRQSSPSGQGTCCCCDQAPLATLCNSCDTKEYGVSPSPGLLAGRWACENRTMSDGESQIGIDTDPEAEARAAAAHGEDRDSMPEVPGRGAAPEGSVPARQNGTSRRKDPDAPPPDQLPALGREIIDQLAAEGGANPLPPDRYLDREESWLRFNQRVLELAEDDAVPLLERVRFLAIFASNLDEFFMVRVAGLMRRMAAGLPVEGVSVQLPGQVLNRTLELTGRLTARHAACFSEQVLPALNAQGIEILRWKELSSGERDNLRELFRERIYPVLTPLVVDPAHPFPFISGLSLNLAVMVADGRTGASMFARVKGPA